MNRKQQRTRRQPHATGARHRAGRSSRSPLPKLALSALVVLVGCGDSPPTPDAPPLVVGSKAFTESVILGEIVSGLARGAGARVEHRRALGGTEILWSALLSGEIDVYPDYTGTLLREVLAAEQLTDASQLPSALAAHGVTLLPALGFDNTYALGMTDARADALGIARISDLAHHPGLVFGFGHEFLQRPDGWPGLKSRYTLPQRDVRGIDHDLGYRALATGDIDVMDLYATDGEIAAYELRMLEDDRALFPVYDAVLLVRSELVLRSPDLARTLSRLGGRIDRETMVALNSSVKQGGASERAAAEDYLRRTFGLHATTREARLMERVLARTGEHLRLVGLSLFAAILCAVPLGVLAARRPALRPAILGVTGVIQTIPSLALLVFMIPALGIGAGPAICALFLYSLLPIVRNTASGLSDVPPHLNEAATALGLSPAARLRLVELPLASRSILAGIKTSAVINVGTATLGAFIGAGGYGQPILSGIRLADTGLLMEGAVPAALLALIVQGLFDLSERRLVPRGLRLPGAQT